MAHMQVPPTEQDFIFNMQGIGGIQLGKMPKHVRGLIPLKDYRHRQRFMVLPDISRFYVFNGSLKARLRHPQSTIDIRYLLAGTNEQGFINSLFVYPMPPGGHIAERLSQVYGEPRIGLGNLGGQVVNSNHFWVTEGETEISYVGPEPSMREMGIIVFRFFYDSEALHQFTLALKR